VSAGRRARPAARGRAAGPFARAAGPFARPAVAAPPPLGAFAALAALASDGAGRVGRPGPEPVRGGSAEEGATAKC